VVYLSFVNVMSVVMNGLLSIEIYVEVKLDVKSVGKPDGLLKKLLAGYRSIIETCNY
jgi:hypothetical protein